GVQWNTDRCPTIRDSIRKIVNGGRFAFSGQTEVVKGPVYGAMLIHYRAKRFTDFIVYFFGATGPHGGIGEVGVHARAVPVGIPKRFGMVFYIIVILFRQSVQ